MIETVGHLPMAGAGHSLGEYTALCAANVFSFEEGLRLVAARGAAMSEAAGQAPSGMAALLGADDDQAEEVAAGRRADGGQLWVANLNGPGQVVLAGAIDDIDWLVSHAADVGIRRAVKLNVGGAFHSPLWHRLSMPLLVLWTASTSRTLILRSGPMSRASASPSRMPLMSWPARWFRLSDSLLRWRQWRLPGSIRLCTSGQVT